MFFLYTKYTSRSPVVCMAFTHRKRALSDCAEVRESHPSLIWRLHDTSGWCDGSDTAGQYIVDDSADCFAGIVSGAE